MSSPTLAASPKQLEDPLMYLPCSKIVDFRKGQIVYSDDQPSTSLYLIIDGKVKVCRGGSDSARPTILDIYGPDEFFGESALLAVPERNELSIAVEGTKVMRWTVAEIETLSAASPKLAIALLQLQVQRSMDFVTRIESFSLDNIERRLARTLLRFSDRLGHTSEDGSVHMIPLTHELLSQYVGTSREIVTHYMNLFRRQGYLKYSRRGILLHRDVMTEAVNRAAETAALEFAAAKPKSRAAQELWPKAAVA